MIDLDITNDIETPRWSFDLEPDQWDAVGQVAVKAMRDRLSSGVGSDGSPMPRLSRRYAARKRRFGGSGIRDLRGDGRSGHMLDSLTVQPSEREVEVAVDSSQIKKAIANSAIAPWFGLSPADQETVGDAVFEALTGEAGRAA